MSLTLACSSARSTVTRGIGRLLSFTSLPGGLDVHVNRKSGGFPFGKSFEHTLRAATLRSKNLDGSIGVDAVRSAAIRHVFLIFRELAKAPLELVDGH